jgi:hypothetical protein
MGHPPGEGVRKAGAPPSMVKQPPSRGALVRTRCKILLDMPGASRGCNLDDVFGDCASGWPAPRGALLASWPLHDPSRAHHVAHQKPKTKNQKALEPTT